MYLMSDIQMSLDDTLELDTIIEESTRASNPIGTVKYEGSDSTVHNSTGIQTNTFIFDPQEAGKYTIPVNGQELTVNVTKASAIPDSDAYIHDDWDDGKLTNRDDSGTTTTNEQEGFYRPEWNEFQANVNVVDKYGDSDGLQMELTQSSGIDIKYPLPDDSLRWEFEFRKDGDDSDNGLMFILSADESQNYIAWRHIGNNNKTGVKTP